MFTLAQGPPPLDPTTILASQPKGPNGNPHAAERHRAERSAADQRRTMRLPTVDAWNFTIEHQFTPSTVLSVGYVGNNGYHVTPGGTNYNINQPTIVGFGTLSTNQRRLFLPEVRLDAEHQVLQRRRQREIQLAPGARRKALRQRPQFQGNFTWASAFDFANDYFFWNHDIDYGRENGVRRFVFNFNHVYELRSARASTFLKNALARGRCLCSEAGSWPASGPGSRAFRSRRRISIAAATRTPARAVPTWSAMPVSSNPTAQAVVRHGARRARADAGCLATATPTAD